MQVMNGRFTAVIEPAEEGGFWAYCPEVAGANGRGDTAEEAEAHLHEAVQLVLESQTLDEAAWVFEAARLGITTREAIVAWADEKIMQMDQPPYWLIELSTLGSSDSRDYASVIQPQLRVTLTHDRRVSLVISSLDRQFIEFDTALDVLFRVWLPLPPEEPVSGFPEPIADLLAEWDRILDGEPLPDDFVSRCRKAFADHLEPHGGPPSTIFHLSSPLPC